MLISLLQSLQNVWYNVGNNLGRRSPEGEPANRFAYQPLLGSSRARWQVANNGQHAVTDSLAEEKADRHDARPSGTGQNKDTVANLLCPTRLSRLAEKNAKAHNATSQTPQSSLI